MPQKGHQMGVTVKSVGHMSYINSFIQIFISDMKESIHYCLVQLIELYCVHHMHCLQIGNLSHLRIFLACQVDITVP